MYAYIHLALICLVAVVKVLSGRIRGTVLYLLVAAARVAPAAGVLVVTVCLQLLGEFLLVDNVVCADIGGLDDIVHIRTADAKQNHANSLATNKDTCMCYVIQGVLCI